MILFFVVTGLRHILGLIYCEVKLMQLSSTVLWKAIIGYGEGGI